MAKTVQISEVLKALVDQTAIIIDILEPEAYHKVHIKNAINVPVRHIEEDIFAKVDKKTPLIIYGIDYEDPTARIAAEKLEEMGYEDVSYYPGGKKEWLETEMPVIENE